MLSTLLVVLLTQVPCGPTEMSVVCHCKQGMVSACVTLAGDDARIAERLAKHRTLKGLFEPWDPRFVARAKDEQAHCGYQEWHREVDKEVIDWLNKHPKATPKEFMDKLRDIYSRPEMKARFPNGF